MARGKDRDEGSEVTGKAGRGEKSKDRRGANSHTAKSVKQKDAAKRILFWCMAVFIGLGTVIGVGTVRGDASWSPRLGLDLAGGTQIILTPRADGGSVSPEQLDQARDIILQRVDAQGTVGAEITTLGNNNIVISVPDTLSEQQRRAISSASQMQFRAVLATMPNAAPTAAETDGADPDAAEPDGTESADPSESPAASPSGESEASPTEGRTETSSSRDLRREPTSTDEPTGTDSPSPTSSGTEGSGTESPGTETPSTETPNTDDLLAELAGQWEPTGEPTSPTDPNNVSAELWKEFVETDCAQINDDLQQTQESSPADEAILACDQDGTLKYILSPMVLSGDQIDDASAGYEVTSQGTQTNTPQIQLTFKSGGRDTYREISGELLGYPRLQDGLSPPANYNSLATVLDDQVLIAPYFSSAIPNGQSSISGFSIEESRALAESLKFGALPLSFDVESESTISATLGSEQLRWGIIAGAIGLVIVVIYSLFQYRALSIVSIGSMAIAFGFTYLVMLLLGWLYNWRLDMAGVTGLIIAIGTTADSFIVYFERVRDELREGRNLRAAVEAGWHRGKRTILAAKGVSLLAAVVLYVLASSGVRGFALTLGLTTLIDIIVFWVFTHPLLTVLARRPFFAKRGPWSGFDVGEVKDPRVTYTGAGRVRVTPRAATSEGSAR